MSPDDHLARVYQAHHRGHHLADHPAGGLGEPGGVGVALGEQRGDVGPGGRSGIPRRINRETLDADRLAAELTGSPRRRGMFDGLRHLLTVRRTRPGFSPFAAQSVERHDVLRLAPHGYAWLVP